MFYAQEEILITLQTGCFNGKMIFYGDKKTDEQPATSCTPGDLERIFINIGINLHRYSEQVLRPFLWRPDLTTGKLKPLQITAVQLSEEGEKLFSNRFFFTNKNSAPTVPKSRMKINFNISYDFLFYENLKKMALLLCSKGNFSPALESQGPIWEINPRPVQVDLLWKLVEASPFRLFSLTSDISEKPDRFIGFNAAHAMLTRYVNSIISKSASSRQLPESISKNLLSEDKPDFFDTLIYCLKNPLKTNNLFHKKLSLNNSGSLIHNKTSLISICQSFSDFPELRFLKNMTLRKKSPFSDSGFPLKFFLRLDVDKEANKWFLEFTSKERRRAGRVFDFQKLWETLETDKGFKFSGKKYTNKDILIFMAECFDLMISIMDSLMLNPDENPGAELLFKELAKGLKETTPASIELSPASTLFFLKNASLEMQSQGVGLFLPSWWLKRHRTRASLSMRPASSLTGFNNSTGDYSGVFDVNWKITIDDKDVTLEELEEMSRQKMSLIKFRDTWIEVDVKQLKETLKFLKKTPEKLSLNEAMRLTLEHSAEDTEKGDSTPSINAGGWLRQILEKLSNKKKELDSSVAKTFQGILRPYQNKGLAWLEYLSQIGLGACLADDMGLGKTVQALAMLQKRFLKKNCSDKCCLIISPTSIVDNWAHETHKFTPDLQVFVHHGQQRPKKEEFKKIYEKYNIIITSYGLVQRDIEILLDYKWSVLIIDEAQKIKNPGTKQSKSVKKIRAHFKIAMTGTPVENNLWDLWSIMDFLNPGYLGKKREFKTAFAQAVDDSDSGNELKNRLKRLTSPLILRRHKTDKDIISDLPEKIENKIYCNLTMEQAALYKAVLDKSRENIEDSSDIKRKGIILSTLTKLKQICNHPAHFLKDNSPLQGRSGKFEHLMEMLDEAIQNGDHALIFTQYKEMGDLLQAYIANLFNEDVFYLHGGISKNNRNKMVTSFQQDKKAPSVFILSLRAGGVGLNLTRANHVFHFDRWWNPAVENQATDRAYRIGQKRTVQVHKLICSGTLEENIDALLFSKEKIANDIVSAGENWLTNLSNNELKELLALRIDTFRG